MFATVLKSLVHCHVFLLSQQIIRALWAVRMHFDYFDSIVDIPTSWGGQVTKIGLLAIVLYKRSINHLKCELRHRFIKGSCLYTFQNQCSSHTRMICQSEGMKSIGEGVTLPATQLYLMAYLTYITLIFIFPNATNSRLSQWETVHTLAYSEPILFQF